MKRSYYHTSDTPYNAWIRFLQEDRFEDGDTFELGALRTNLYNHWSQYMRAIQNLTLNPHEPEIRIGIQNMIELAFETRLAGQHIHRSVLFGYFSFSYTTR